MNQDHLLRDIVALTDGGGRNVGSTGHQRAREYIVQRLTDLGLTPYTNDSFVLPYGPDEFVFGNIVGTITGTNSEMAPILLGAHYDTCGDIPGADDNAAAVAVLLGSAEILLSQECKRSIVLAFFDAEEPPNFLESTMGSIRFYEDQRTGPVHAAIILDLVGHDVPVPGLEDLLFITGAESDPVLEAAVRQSEPEAGLRTVPTLNSYVTVPTLNGDVGDLSDHHVFRKNECPYLLLTCGRWEHYHSNTDTVDKLNIAKIEAVANYAVTLIEKLCDSSVNGPFQGNETLPTEIYFLKKNIMPTLRDLGMSPPLNSRADIDKLVALLMTQFGL